MRAPGIRSLILLAALFSSPCLAGEEGPLFGSWLLQEQTYGEGSHDFADPQEELVLRFGRTAGGRLTAAMVWQGEPLPWPSYPTPAGPAQIRLLERTIAEDLSSARALYRVPPGPGDDTSLLVDERCFAGEGGELRCTLKLSFERGGAVRGGFTWKRVFRRRGER